MQRCQAVNVNRVTEEIIQLKDWFFFVKSLNELSYFFLDYLESSYRREWLFVNNSFFLSIVQ